jgi:hypothetical protein
MVSAGAGDVAEAGAKIFHQLQASAAQKKTGRNTGLNYGITETLLF